VRAPGEQAEDVTQVEASQALMPENTADDRASTTDTDQASTMDTDPASSTDTDRASTMDSITTVPP
jgi:hypothetical protein